MRAQGQSNLAITATIPLDNLGPEATGALTTVASFAHFLPDAVTRAGEIHEPVPPEYLGQMRRQLEEAIATLRGLVLHRHEGVWRWISPELSEWLRKGNKVS